MRPATGQCGLGRWVGKATVLLALPLFTPASARASCGDYVLFGNGPAHAAGVKHTPQPGPGPAEPVTPCRGPTCSRAPLPVPAPATPPAGETRSPPVLLPTASPAAAGGGGEPIADAVSPHPSHRSRDIFHPPRVR
jgi:hypothetical protein